MTQPNLLELARQGDPQAIATLMNRSLQPRGMVATVARQGDRLQVELEADQVPNRQVLTTFVQNGIKNLQPRSIRAVDIVARQTSLTEPVWTQSLVVEPPLEPSAVGETAAPLTTAPPPPEPSVDPEPTRETIIQADNYPAYQPESSAENTIGSSGADLTTEFEPAAAPIEQEIEQEPQPADGSLDYLDDIVSPSTSYFPAEPPIESTEAIAPPLEYDSVELSPSLDEPAELLTDETVTQPYSDDFSTQADHGAWEVPSILDGTDEDVAAETTSLESEFGSPTVDLSQEVEPSPSSSVDDLDLISTSELDLSPEPSVGPLDDEPIASATGSFAHEIPEEAEVSAPPLLDDYHALSASEPDSTMAQSDAELITPPSETFQEAAWEHPSPVDAVDANSVPELDSSVDQLDAELVTPPSPSVEAWSDPGFETGNGEAITTDLPTGSEAQEFVVDESDVPEQEPVSVEFFDLDSSSNHHRDDSDYPLSAYPIEEPLDEPLPTNNTALAAVSASSTSDGYGEVSDYPDQRDSLEYTTEPEPVLERSERRRFPFGLLLALAVVGGWIAVLIGSALWMELINPRPIEPVPEGSPEALVPSSGDSSSVATVASSTEANLQAIPPSEALETASARATRATTLAQAAQSVDDWTLVASQWQQAIALLETVPATSSDYDTAQQRLADYRGNLAAAEQRASQTPSVAAAPTTTVTVSSDISCRGAEATAESQPIELTNVQFSQDATQSEETYIIGCVTNHTNQPIATLDVSYTGGSAENPQLLSDRVDRLNFSTLNPKQTVPFRSNFTVPTDATSIRLTALYWTPPGASEPEQIQASVVLDRDS